MGRKTFVKKYCKEAEERLCARIREREDQNNDASHLKCALQQLKEAESKQKWKDMKSNIRKAICCTSNDSMVMNILSGGEVTEDGIKPVLKIALSERVWIQRKLEHLFRHRNPFRSEFAKESLHTI